MKKVRILSKRGRRRRAFENSLSGALFLLAPGLAAQIIVAHNHPSGDPKPSEDDLELTKRLMEAGKLMGIEVMDHIIISKNTHFSFKEKCVA